jgi:RNA polymerase sigma-70 factor (ECF subfamily)
MSDTRPIDSTKSSPQGRFVTTQWTVVLAAGSPDSPGHRQALEALCRTYWFPLYAYLRRQGCDSHQAQDYTQGFFASLLERQALQRADPAVGRFRSFLLASLKHFIADERDRTQAKKRGGGKCFPLDVDDAETRYSLEPADNMSPEKLFMRSWALTVLKEAMTQLKAECVEAGKGHIFERLKTHLQAGEAPAGYSDIAAELGMTESAVRVAVHRLRQRYGEFVRRQIAQTVANPGEVDEELRELVAALTS